MKEKMVKCECGIEIIFVLTNKGNNMPVDFSSIQDEELKVLAKGGRINYKHGIHVPHWATCTKPDKFRKKKNDSANK